MKRLLPKILRSRSVQGAALTVLCGMAVWSLPFGKWWVDTSYDYLFRVTTRHASKEVVFVAMDENAYDQLHQTPGQTWDRALHARLLNKLADDGCSLVVLDTFFRSQHDVVADQRLADAIARQRAVVLMAGQAEISNPGLEGVRPLLPTEPFLSSAKGNWGVGSLEDHSIVRHQWPDPSPGPYPSLAWAAAKAAGAKLGEKPETRWIRYYDQASAWTTVSYPFALTKPEGYFRDKIIFVGATAPMAGAGQAEFKTPFSRWTGLPSGGVEITMTAFLNLLDHEWLSSLPGWAEAALLVLAGSLMGTWLSRLKVRVATFWAIGIFAGTALAGMAFSLVTNYWVPWLIISAAQLPVALVWSILTQIRVAAPQTDGEVVTALTPSVASSGAPVAVSGHGGDMPDTPDYEIVSPAFGRGAYGKVWLARNAVGQWQALKTVYLSSFENDSAPYEREFNGISRYKPISDKHPGLLRVDFVSRKRDDHFYYVMELGDPLQLDWERDPTTYKPRDLVSVRAKLKGKRLPVRDCLQLGITLSDALDFLHRQGLTHRDIKPQNIVFVNGLPKLADIGLMGRIRPAGEEATSVGTPGYMPPAPEPLGTVQADVYSLGMVLYVLSTGSNPAHFPEISSTLVSSRGREDFFPLNSLILKACDPDCANRFTTAAAMHAALLEVKRVYDREVMPATESGMVAQPA